MKKQIFFLLIIFLIPLVTASSYVCQDETYSSNVPCMVITPVLNCTSYYVYNLTDITDGANTLLINNGSLISIGGGIYEFSFDYSDTGKSYSILLCDNNSATISVTTKPIVSAGEGSTGGGSSGSNPLANQLYYVKSTMASELNINKENELVVETYDYNMHSLNVDTLNITLIPYNENLSLANVKQHFKIEELSPMLGVYKYNISVDTSIYNSEKFKVMFVAAKSGTAVSDFRNFTVVDKEVLISKDTTEGDKSKMAWIFGIGLLLLLLLIYFLVKKK